VDLRSLKVASSHTARHVRGPQSPTLQSKPAARHAAGTDQREAIDGYDYLHQTRRSVGVQLQRTDRCCAMQSLLFGLSASLAQCPAAQNDRATVIITFRCIFSSSLVRQPRVHLHSFLSLMMFIASSTLKLTLLRSC